MYLVHGIRKLNIKVLDDARHLPLQLQLMAFLEVQPRRIDHGQQDAFEPRFANLDASCIDDLCSLCTVSEKAVHGRSLFGGRGR